LFLHDENAQCLALLEEMNAIFWNRMEWNFLHKRVVYNEHFIPWLL
jgi:hypothetical protein